MFFTRLGGWFGGTLVAFSTEGVIIGLLVIGFLAVTILYILHLQRQVVMWQTYTLAGQGAALAALDEVERVDPMRRQKSLTYLRDMITEGLNDSDVNALRWDLDIDDGVLPKATSRREAVQVLIDYLDARRRIPELRALLRRQYPDIFKQAGS
jgi:hypothetical protein